MEKEVKEACKAEGRCLVRVRVAIEKERLPNL